MLPGRLFQNLNCIKGGIAGAEARGVKVKTFYVVKKPSTASPHLYMVTLLYIFATFAVVVKVYVFWILVYFLLFLSFAYMN